MAKRSKRIKRSSQPTEEELRRNAAALWKKGYPIYKELREAGIPHMEAIGIIGNMALESSFDPRIASDTGTYTGYVQNSTDISNYIKKYYGGYGHREQMQYIIDGMFGRLKGGRTSMGTQMQKRFDEYKRRMRGVTDPREAARHWENSYERSGEQAIKSRMFYADYFNNMAGNHNHPTPEIPYRKTIVPVQGIDWREGAKEYLPELPEPKYTISMDAPVSLYVDDNDDLNLLGSNDFSMPAPVIEQLPFNYGALFSPIQPSSGFSYFNDPYDNNFI